MKELDLVDKAFVGFIAVMALLFAAAAPALLILIYRTALGTCP